MRFSSNGILRSHPSRPAGAEAGPHAFHPPPSSHDPLVAALGCLAALGAIIAVGAGGATSAVELALIGAVVIAAYAADWAPPVPTAFAGAVGYLALEGLAGRLGYDRYWTHILVLVLLAGAVLGAAKERRVRTERRAGYEALGAQLEQLQSSSTLGRLLDANRPGDVEQELIRSRRHGHSASVLLVRPDELDDIGLRHGEDGVREVLRAIAQTIGAITRGTDTGASEPAHDFLILLPETAASGARVAAERLRLAAAAQRLVFGPGEPVDLSVSIGTASFPEDAADSTELLDRAGAALERALELGGNRTVLHTAPPTSPPRWGMTRAIVPGARTL